MSRCKMGRKRGRFSRGAALPEYTVALLVAISAIAGMATGGYRMLDNYRTVRANLVKTGP